MKSCKEAFQDKQKIETILKILLANVVGFILSVVPLPQAIPPGQRYLIGVVVASTCLTVPAVVCMFPILALYFPIIFSIALAAATLVLSGALVSKGLMTALFAVMSLWFSGLRFQANPLAAGSATMFILVPSMMSLSFYQLVESVGSPTALAALWTTSGVTNKLAVFQNMLITLSWAALVLGIIFLTPPFRTTKQMLSKGLVPQALMGMAGHLKALTTEPDDANSNELDPDKTKQNDSAYLARVNALIGASNALGNGGSAALVAFEPSPTKPHQVLWVPLSKMMKDIHLTIGVTLATGYLIHEDKEDASEAETAESGAANKELQNKILNDCAAALEQCAARMMSDKLEPPIEFSCSYRHDEINISWLELEPLVLKVESIVNQVNGWNNLLHGSHKVGFKDFFKGIAMNMLPIVPAFGGILKRLLQEITFVFKPKAYLALFKDSKHKRGKELHYPPYAGVVWYFRYALGATLLYIFQLYIPAVKSFGIPVLSAGGSTISYVGWHVIAYLCATTPTVQGTLKKGVARLVGTVVGGFSGWAAIQACGLYPNTNQPGLITWLSVTTLIVSFLMIPSGIASNLGMRQDVGAFGMYFLSTQALVALEAVNGVHDVNDLTLNRIVANLTGIIMAMLIAIMPPTLNGGDPVFTRNMVSAERVAVSNLFDALLNPETCNKKSLEKSMNSSFEVITYWRTFSNMLYKDATSIMPGIKCLSADAGLNTTMQSAAVTGGLIVVLYSTAEGLLEEEGLTCDDFQSIKEDMLSLVNGSDEESETDEKKELPEGSKDVGAVPAEPKDSRLKAFMSFSRLIMLSLDTREKELSSVKFGWVGVGKCGE